MKSMKVLGRLQIAKNWLPRYTGMKLDFFGDYILLTNFKYYLNDFAERFKCDIYGEKRPMQAATNNSGLTIINFSMGSPNAATIMDLLCARQPKGVLALRSLPSWAILFSRLRRFEVKEPAMTISRRKFPPFRPSNCINSSRKKLFSTAWSIEQALCTRQTVASGSMTSDFTKN